MVLNEIERIDMLINMEEGYIWNKVDKINCVLPKRNIIQIKNFRICQQLKKDGTWQTPY